jgi:hypothetical protein
MMARDPANIRDIFKISLGDYEEFLLIHVTVAVLSQEVEVADPLLLDEVMKSVKHGVDRDLR